jgi:hypothetical protein
MLSPMHVAAYAHHLVFSIMKDVELKGPTCIEVPHLVRANSMKSRKVTSLKEIKDPRTHTSGTTETASECADGYGV